MNFQIVLIYIFTTKDQQVKSSHRTVLCVFSRVVCYQCMSSQQLLSIGLALGFMRSSADNTSSLHWEDMEVS